MSLKKAREHLKGSLCTDGGLDSLGPVYIKFVSGEDCVVLDGEFSDDDLEAIVVFMRGATNNNKE